MSAIWKTSPDLMGCLTTAQNHPAHWHLDIMTFAALCTSRDELERHVLLREATVAAWAPPRRVRQPWRSPRITSLAAAAASIVREAGL